MMTLPEVRESLKDRRLKTVAEACGLNYRTVLMIVHETTDPAYSTLKRLSDYLEGKEVEGKK